MASEPNLSYIQEVIEAKAKLIQPPDYWMTIRDASFPNFGFSDAETEQLISEGESPFLRFWIRSIPLRSNRQRNNAELSPIARVMTAIVIKGSSNLQRQMALATADMINLMMGDGAQAHPEFTGENTWGLMTRDTPGRDIVWEQPKLAGAGGCGIVWGSWDVEFRHPMPKG